MTIGTVEAIRLIRKVVADTQGASPAECLAAIAHEMGFLIAFLVDRGEDEADVSHLVDVSASAGSDAYREGAEAMKNAN